MSFVDTLASYFTAPTGEVATPPPENAVRMNLHVTDLYRVANLALDFDLHRAAPQTAPLRSALPKCATPPPQTGHLRTTTKLFTSARLELNVIRSQPRQHFAGPHLTSGLVSRPHHFAGLQNVILLRLVSRPHHFADLHRAASQTAPLRSALPKCAPLPPISGNTVTRKYFPLAGLEPEGPRSQPRLTPVTPTRQNRKLGDITLTHISLVPTANYRRTLPYQQRPLAQCRKTPLSLT